MPELPEIETIRRIIEPQIQGVGIERVAVSRPEVIAHPDADGFCSRLKGQVFDRVERRGKFLIIRLKSSDRIIIHLRMTGCLLAAPADDPEEKHTHVIFRLNGFFRKYPFSAFKHCHVYSIIIVVLYRR